MLEAARPRLTAEELGPPDNAWGLGWAARGVAAERARGGDLGNFPVINRFTGGIAVSIKSIDLDAETYRNPLRLESRIDRYVEKLVRFNGATWGDKDVAAKDIRGRMLDLVVPKGSITPEQELAISRARARAGVYGVAVLVTEF